MIRLVAALAVLGLALGLAGCYESGGGEAQPPATETQPPATEPPATETQPPATTGGSAEAGKAVFVASCGGCHVLAAAGTSGAVGPNLDETTPSADLVAAQVRAGGKTMPAFEGVLSEQEILDVAAFVGESAGG